MTNYTLSTKQNFRLLFTRVHTLANLRDTKALNVVYLQYMETPFCPPASSSQNEIKLQYNESTKMSIE